MNKNLTKIIKNALAALSVVVMLLLANTASANGINPIVVKFANNGKYAANPSHLPNVSAYDIYTLGALKAAITPPKTPSNVSDAGGWAAYEIANGLNDNSEFIIFHATISVGPSLTEIWSFDGNNYTINAPTENSVAPGYSFTYPGVHSVTLTVTDANGGSNSQTISVTTIGQNPIPIINTPSIYGPSITTVSDGSGVRQPGVATVTLNENATVAFGNLAYTWVISTNTNGAGWVIVPVYDPSAIPAQTTYVNSLSVSNPQVTVPQPATGSTLIKYTLTATDVVGSGFVNAPSVSALYVSSSNIIIPGLYVSSTPTVNIKTITQLIDQTTPPLPITGTDLTPGHTYKTTSYSGCSESFQLSADVSGLPSKYILTLHKGDEDLVYNSTETFPTYPDLLTGHTIIYNNPNTSGYIVSFDVKDLSGNLLATSGQVKLISTTGNIPSIDPTTIDFTINNDDVLGLTNGNEPISSSYLQATSAKINLNASVSGNATFTWSPSTQTPIDPGGKVFAPSTALPSLNITGSNISKSNPSLTITRGGVDNTINLFTGYTNGTTLWANEVAVGNTNPDDNGNDIPYLQYPIKLTVSPKGCPASVLSTSVPQNVLTYVTGTTFPVVSYLSANIQVPLNDASQSQIFSVGKITTYPNPVVDAVNVNVTLKNPSSHVVVAVYDMAGTLKLSSKVSASSNVANAVLNVSHLSTGFYKVTVTNAEGQLVQTKSIFKN